ncbi:MAG: heme NO-binding domain-containing protein [Thermoanaerobaculia bacterium]
MDGIIMNQFQRFVVSRFGRDAWTQLIRAADVPLGEELLSVGATYPDAYLFAMVPVASQATGIAVPELLEQFGTFVAPTLLRVYAPLLNPTWRTLDVITNTEPAIHRVVRQRNPDAAPPELRVERTGPDEVSIDYRSQRKLCFVAVGISHGIANHFAETVSINQSECTHRGDRRCLIIVRLQR